MAAKLPKTGQVHVEDEIIDLLYGGHIWTTAEINKAIRLRVTPTSADNERANKRTTETKYDQIISNCLEAGRGICKRGLIERVSVGAFRITPTGRSFVEERRNMIASLTEFLPDGD